MKRVLPDGSTVDATAAERERIEREAAAVERGSAGPVYPVLKAHDWQGRQHAVVRYFLGKDKPPLPLVAYAYNLAEDYMFVTTEKVAPNGESALHAEAMANLARVVVAWTPLDDHMLTGAGHDLSAEKLLCDDFVLAAHRQLDASSVWIAAPRRRVIYACSTAAPEPIKERFLALVARTLADDSFGNALITNLVLEYRGTSVVDAFEVLMPVMGSEASHRQSVYEVMQEFFRQDDWEVKLVEAKRSLWSRYRGEHGAWRCYCQGYEDARQVVFYSILDVAVPVDKRPLIAEFITRANYGLRVGNFEMDFNDGEIRYKTSVDVRDHDDALAPALIKRIVNPNLATFDRYLPGITSVLSDGTSPADALAKIEES